MIRQIILEVISLISTIILCMYDYFIISDIVYYQTDEEKDKNAQEKLSHKIKSYVSKIKLLHLLTTILMIIHYFSGWVLALLHLLIYLHFNNKKTQKSFLPKKASKDHYNRHKYTFTGFLVMNIFSILYIFILMFLN